MVPYCSCIPLAACPCFEMIIQTDNIYVMNCITFSIMVGNLENSLVFHICIRIKINDTAKLKELFTTARFARCRSRFVIPVLLYENKV